MVRSHGLGTVLDTIAFTANRLEFIAHLILFINVALH